jgi:hypothetical protein
MSREFYIPLVDEHGEMENNKIAKGTGAKPNKPDQKAMILTPKSSPGSPPPSPPPESTREAAEAFVTDLLCAQCRQTSRFRGPHTASSQHQRAQYLLKHSYARATSGLDRRRVNQHTLSHIPCTCGFTLTVPPATLDIHYNQHILNHISRADLPLELFKYALCDVNPRVCVLNSERGTKPEFARYGERHH